MKRPERPLIFLLITALLSASLVSCSDRQGPDEAVVESANPTESTPIVEAPPPPPPDPTQLVAETLTGVYREADRTAYSLTQKGQEPISKAPCLGAIAVDTATGKILYEENAEALALPASMTKMMTLLLIQERIEAGLLATNAIVGVSRRAFETGGSQVYLDPRESFPVEDMLYALMIQSANDAAVALAEHVAGTCEAFVVQMNRKAEELGMRNTHFESVHGLPAPDGKPNDISTPRDMAILAVELCKHPDIFRYTATGFRVFRPNSKQPFEMRTHNPFLQPRSKIPGCDGLKTGYTKRAGYSIATTIVQDGRRLLLVSMGSSSKDARDAKLRELLSIASTTAAATLPPPTFPIAPIIIPNP